MRSIKLKSMFVVLATVCAASSTGALADCMNGKITSLTIEPKVGYMSVEFAGTARFTVKSNTSDVGENVYISETQQNYDQLYSAVLAAKTSQSDLEVCWDSNAANGVYKRMNRLTIN